MGSNLFSQRKGPFLTKVDDVSSVMLGSMLCGGEMGSMDDVS